MSAGTSVILLLLVGSSLPASADPPVTRVAVEVFRVGFTAGGSGGLVFSRAEGRLENGGNPDRRARGLAADDPRAIALVHSTSWRWEPDGRIVLTYLAWMKDGRVGSSARLLPPLPSPGPTDPLHPRPAEIGELDPLAHGLRHLAFLVRTSRGGAVAAELGPNAIAALRPFEPDTAGELP
jgi:hypothetical protein